MEKDFCASNLRKTLDSTCMPCVVDMPLFHLFLGEILKINCTFFKEKHIKPDLMWSFCGL